MTEHDVDTVFVDGKILMEGRKLKTIGGKKILRGAQKEVKLMVERSCVEPFMVLTDRFLGALSLLTISSQRKGA